MFSENQNRILNRMKHTEPNKGGGGTQVGLTAFILYEDKPTGLRAKAVLDSILHRLDADAAGACSPELWRLDLLDQPSLRNAASRAAAKADLGFVSLHGNRVPSPAIIDWLCLWSQGRKRSHQALVILLDKAHCGTLLVEEILYGLNCAAATQKGLAVFRHFLDPPNDRECRTQIASAAALSGAAITAPSAPKATQL